VPECNHHILVAAAQSLLGLALLSVSVPARAGDANVPPHEPAADEGSASALPAEDPKVQEARERFRRGISFYEEADYRLALIEFERAYELVPNYRVLFNIGQVAISLGQFARARIVLERYLAEGGANIDDTRRESVGRDLEMLGRRTATIELKDVGPDAEIVIDDRPLGDSRVGDSIILDAGEHRIRIIQRKFLPGEKRFTLAGGENLVLSIELQPEPVEDPSRVVVAPPPTAPKAPSTSPTLVAARWTSWIATGVLLTGAVATGIVGSKKASDLSELRATPDPDVDLMNQTASQANSWLVASDVFLVASGTALATSLFLQFYSPKRESGGANHSRVDVLASPSLVGASVSGRF
jgi:hypothetical protein